LLDYLTSGQISKVTNKAKAYKHLFALVIARSLAEIDNSDLAEVEENDS
jgi:hypothetical protein